MKKMHTGILMIASVFMAITRTAIVIFNIDKDDFADNTYYLLDNFKTKVFDVASLIIIIAVFVFAALAGRGKITVPDTKNNGVTAVSCMLAFMLMGTVVIFFTDLAGKEGAKVTEMDIAVVIFTLLSAAVFLMSGIRQYNEKFLALFALAPLGLTALRLLNDFIKTNSAPFVNSGAYHISGMVALLMFFLCEGKSFISKGSSALHFGFGHAAVFLLSVYAFPNLILHCFGILEFDYSASLSAVDIIIAAYICLRLSSASFAEKKKDLSEA